MNQRNVDALAAIFEEITEHWQGNAVANWYGLAESLAARGVLVPSVLTVDEVGDMFDCPARENYRVARVENLECIAKGVEP